MHNTTIKTILLTVLQPEKLSHSAEEQQDDTTGQADAAALLDNMNSKEHKLDKEQKDRHR